MIYFLDTNIIIYFLNGKYKKIGEKLFSLRPRDVQIPAVVKAELLYGVAKSNYYQENKSKVLNFLKPFKIASFDNTASETYGDLRCLQEKKGEIIGANDLLIASIVKSNMGTLVTNNDKEFSRVENLKIENWVT